MTQNNSGGDTTLYDPTAEDAPPERVRLSPPASLDGKTIALMDIGKTRSDEFLDRLEEQLTASGHRTLRFAKPTNTKVASPTVLNQLAEQADVVIEALAD